MLEIVEGGPIYTLSEIAKAYLDANYQGYILVKGSAVGGRLPDYSPDFLVNDTITDNKDGDSPTPEYIRDEIRSKLDEAVMYMRGLMGAM